MQTLPPHPPHPTPTRHLSDTYPTPIRHRAFGTLQDCNLSKAHSIRHTYPTHLSDTYPTPVRHLSDTYPTPIRHPSDTYPTPIRHLSDIYLTPVHLSNACPTLVRHFIFPNIHQVFICHTSHNHVEVGSGFPPITHPTTV